MAEIALELALKVAEKKTLAGTGVESAKAIAEIYNTILQQIAPTTYKNIHM